MGKFKYSNFGIIALGLLAIGATLSSLLLMTFITKGYIHFYTIAQLGSTGDFFNGIVSPFISIVSAILIYITFKQQVDTNKEQTDRFNLEQENSKANTDFDRYLKLIDEIEKYQNRIQLEIKNLMSTITTKYEGKEAIEAYIRYISLEDKFRRFQTIENRIEFEKSLYAYIVYLNFIFSNVNNLKKNHFSYYSFLITKLFMNVPNTIIQINGLIENQNVIVIHGNIEANALNMEIFNAKAHVDYITFS